MLLEYEWSDSRWDHYEAVIRCPNDILVSQHVVRVPGMEWSIERQQAAGNVQQMAAAQVRR